MSRLVEAGEALAAALADPANDSSAAVASWRDAVARCAHDGQSAKARAQARRADKAAALRVSSAASARESLAGIAEGLEVDCLTFGQFSLIDALEAILEVTGPAEVVCATWTAAAADLTRACTQMQRAQITRFRLIVDPSFLSRQPRYAAVARERFGDDAIRTARTHAKFMLIAGLEKRFLVRTSMNMNTNPRVEYIQVSGDPRLYDWWSDIAESLWNEREAGLDTSTSLPKLDGIDKVRRRDTVRRGRATTGTAKIGPA